MSQPSEIIIVGGGIWGLSTAFHLGKLKLTNVRVLERNASVALETTPRAAGLVGQIRSSPVMCQGINYALELLSQFSRETGYEVGLHRPGSLLVALTNDRMEAYEHQVKKARTAGVDASFVSHEEMKRLAPEMDVGKLAGGYFVNGDGYLDPQKCARSFGAAAQDLGIKIDLNTEVTGFRIANNKISGVEAGERFIPAERVIVTGGPWTGMLARQAGYRLAMQPIRHQRVCTTGVAGIPDHHPVVRVTDLSCYVRPDQGRYLYGFFEPAPLSIDLESKPARFRTDDIEEPTATMAEAKRRLADVFPILGRLEVAEYHQGMTTFAPDGRYLLGQVPGVDGLFLASGCAALGIAGSAAVGRWLASWVVDGKPDAALKEFMMDRFAGTDTQWVKREAEKFYGSYYSIRSEE